MNRHILQAILDYAANSVWQVPLLAGMTWLAVRIGRPRPAARYWIWIATLALAAVLPLATISRTTVGQPGDAVAEHPAYATESGPATQLPQMPGVGSSFANARNLPTGTDGAKHAVAREFAWFAPHPILLSENVVLWLLAIYGLLLLAQIVRLTLSGCAARRLLQHALHLELPNRERTLLQDCAARMEIHAPTVLFSSETTVPMAIGGSRPAILLPESFFSATKAEMTAALCHELAHLRRWDYAANWACQLGALPIAYHPATQKILQEIRRTRELACDAMAASAMQSPTAYAGCLLNLARRMETQGVQIAGANGLFDHDSFEERIMHLVEPDCVTRGFSRWARGTCAIAFAGASVLTISLFHVTPAMARPAAVTPVDATPALHDAAAPVVFQVTDSNAVPVDAQPILRQTPRAQEGKASPMPKVVPTIELDAQPALSADATTPLPRVVLAVTVPQAKTPAPPAPPAPPKAIPPTAPTPPMPPAPLIKLHKTLPAPVTPPAPTAMQTKEFKSFAPIHFRWTPEQQARIDRQIAQAQANIQQAMKRIQSPEFKAQIAEAERNAEAAARRMQSADMQRQLKYVQMKYVQSPEFKRQVAEMQRQIQQATQKMQSDEFHWQMTYFQSAEFKKQMADMQRQIQEATQQLQKHSFVLDHNARHADHPTAPSSGSTVHPQ